MQNFRLNNMQFWFQVASTVTLMLLSSIANATWVEATGEAQIRNGGISEAREEAINQAVRYASLKGGVKFTSAQETNNGTLTQNSFKMLNEATTGPVELISESITGNKLIIKLRVDIYDNPNQRCQSANTRAAILIPQAGLKDRKQLRYGQLQDFEQDVSEKIIAILNQISATSFSHNHAETKLDINRDLAVVRGYRLPSWLSETTESQYILVPEIIDISTEQEESHMLGLWSSDPIRQFKLQLSLYHGISGEQIWFKSYQTQAPWEFARQVIVATNGDKFWRSAYGASIASVIKSAVADMDTTLSCRPVLGQIVARQQDRVILNLGRRHGVSVGDKFSLILQQSISDRFNQMRPLANKSEATLIIEQISEESATAVLMNKNAAYNVQINDIALKI